MPGLNSGGNLPPSHRGNLLLRSLSTCDAHSVSGHLTRVTFAAGETAASAATLDRAYFPETAVLCIREAYRGDRRPVVGLVGLEGMVGWSLLMDASHSALLATVEMHGGSALAIPADRLIEACRASATLNAAILRYAHNFMTQMAATIASNACDNLERRIARWILMLHDRTQGDTLELTHEHVGNALHVRRASVTDCLHLLEGEGILRCTRGRMVLRERARLEAIAGESYGTVETRYAKDFGGVARAG